MLSSKLSYYLLKMLAGSLIERNSLKQAIYFNCSSLKVLAAERSSLEIRSAQPPQPLLAKESQNAQCSSAQNAQPLPTPSWPSGKRVSKCSSAQNAQPPRASWPTSFKDLKMQGWPTSLKCKIQLVEDNKW